MSCELCKHDIPVLKDRLAQAEKARDIYAEHSKEAGGKLAKAERRIGEWATTAERLRTERDAALAKAEGYRRDQKEATETTLRNMNALADLRARIEALAADLEMDGGRDNCYSLALRLRALLQPPKAETALDLITAWEKRADQDDDSQVTLSVSELGQLRKLLEPTP